MRAVDDTYPLDPALPMHMNRIWMGRHHHAREHFHWHSFYEISCYKNVSFSSWSL